MADGAACERVVVVCHCKANGLTNALEGCKGMVVADDRDVMAKATLPSTVHKSYLRIQRNLELSEMCMLAA